jgi:transposase
LGLKKLVQTLLFLSLKDAELIGCEIIAIDGTKSRAHNSKKANFNQKKIERHLVYIEERTQEYLAD